MRKGLRCEPLEERRLLSFSAPLDLGADENPFVAVDPHDAANVVVGAEEIGARFSTDSAASFAAPTAHADFEDTSALAVDSQGRTFVAYRIEDPVNAALFNIAVSASDFTNQDFTTNTFDVGHDNIADVQPRIAADAFAASPFTDQVYVVWHQPVGGDLAYARSDDNGASFSAPALIGTPTHALTAGADPEVGPNGEIYVLYWDGTDAASGSSGEIRLRKSTNGGIGFVNPVAGGGAVSAAAGTVGLDATGLDHDAVAAGIQSPNQSFAWNVNSMLDLAVDPARPGNLYAVWITDPDGTTAGDAGDVMFSRSTDGGVNWSLPTVLNDDGGDATQHMPSIAVDRDGNLVAIWYDEQLATNPNNPTLTVVAKISDDGGLTFSSDFALPDSTFDPDSGGPSASIGNHTSVAAAEGTAYASWTRTDGGGTNRVVVSTFDLADALAAATPDRFESNDSLAEATVLGSQPTTIVNDLTIHNATDVDIFRVTAHQTGTMAVTAWFLDALGNIDLRIRDANDNDVVVPPATSTTDNERLVFPVVAQQSYFVELNGNGASFNTYDLEIENFAAPVPDAVVLRPADDTGASNSDNVTSNATARIIIEADLSALAAEGVSILSGPNPGGQAPGAAVEVFNNGDSLGYATPIAGTDSTLFEFQFAAGDLSTTFVPVDSSLPQRGGLNFVKAAVRIFDGQGDGNGQPAPVDGRTLQSEPLLLTLDTTGPDDSAPVLLESSDTFDNVAGLIGPQWTSSDGVTAINQPAVSGVGEAGATVHVFATNNTTTTTQLVGQGVVGSDATDDAPGDGLGRWEVTVEPLDDADYNISVRLEDLAGNLNNTEFPSTVQVSVDTLPPQRPTLDLAAVSDSGSSSLDNVTNAPNDVAVLLTAEPGGRAMIKNGQAVIDDFVVLGPNVATVVTLTEGTHLLSVEVFDEAGNRSAQSEELVVTVDRTAPAAPSAPILLTSSDTGPNNADNVTTIDQPAFRGTAEANTLVRIFANGSPVGQGVVGSDGTWEVTVEPLTRGQFDIEAEVEDLAGNVSPLSAALEIVIDDQESNDTLAEATILGSLPAVTLNDLILHDELDVDMLKYTAAETGKLIVNVFSQDDILVRVLDVNGNEIATSTPGVVTPNLNIDSLVIPVVTQQEYFVEITYDGPSPVDPVQQVAVYDVEIENFAAPVPHIPELPALDQADELNDTGRGSADDVTFETEPEIIVEADLNEFAQQGIAVLTAAEAVDALTGAAANPGAAVEVYVNGLPVGFADPIQLPEADTGNTKFRFTFQPGQLPVQTFADESGGWLHNVKAAVRIIDGQRDVPVPPANVGDPAPATGRTQLSEPLELVVDTAVPTAPATIELVETSDTGANNADGITAINQPAFDGTAEANTLVRVFANGNLVGEGVVGSDQTDGVEGDGLGRWEVTVEPLKNGQFEITAAVEDLAGNVGPQSAPITIVVDPYEPNNQLSEATILGSLPKITLNDLLLHNEADVDLLKYTASDTGRLVVNAFSGDAIALRVVDVNGNEIATGADGVVTPGLGIDSLVIPVVTQQEYFIEIAYNGAPVQPPVQHVAVYDLEIENFAAPVPHIPELPALDQADALNDTGRDSADDVTFETEPEIIIEADLNEFAQQGIAILTAAEAADALAGAAANPGAAVEVYVNGLSVGFADPIRLPEADTGNTKFRYTFTLGQLPVQTFADESGGWLHNVKAAVRIIDGQRDVAVPPANVGDPAPATGRTQLSEPLELVIDDVDPLAPSTPNLLETSDTGADNFDNVTAINQPAFMGTAEANTLVRIFANGIENPVGQGVVGSDATDGIIGNGLGLWEVTVEPLKNGQFEITADVEDLAGNLSVLSDALTIVVDPYEPNDELAEATILGSIPKITLNDLLLHDPADVDLFKYTASDTGKLVINAFSGEDIGLQVRDVNNNVISPPATEGVVTPGLNIDSLVIPVVTQEEYFIEITFTGVPPVQDPIQHVAVYDLEIENFPAPVPHIPELPAKDQFEILNDTGYSVTDDVTQRTEPEIIIEADLDEFVLEGITILSAAEAVAQNVPGAAVEVYVNGNSVGFADLVPNTGNTKFRFTFPVGVLPEQLFHDDSRGWLHNVKAAVRIIDGQRDVVVPPANVGDPAPATGRTQLSEPLELVVDIVPPVAPVPDLLASSDSGKLNNDDVTNINRPAFQGTAEHNATIRIFAQHLNDPNDAGDDGPLELVGQGVVGTDLTDGGFDQVGAWEVTVEPLIDGPYLIFAEVEDAAGNITRGQESLELWIDTLVPNTPYLDLITDSGRHDADEITNVNNPVVTVTADDTIDGDGNPFWHDLSYRLFDRPGDAVINGEALLLDSWIDLGTFTEDGFFTHTLSTTLNDPTGPALADGVHELKLEVEDRAGNVSPDFLLKVTIDTIAPPVTIIDIDPPDDTGVEGRPDTFNDRATSETAPSFVGRAEADAIVRLFVDAVRNDTIGTPGEFRLTVALPEDGNLAFPDGQWGTDYLHDLNEPAFFPFDGEREVAVTAEDVAGNVSEPEFLDIFVDTQGPRITSVHIAADPAYDLFNPKPSGGDGPTPLIDSLAIDFSDLPDRAVDFLYEALEAGVAQNPGHYLLVGDANGVIPIQSVNVTNDAPVAGQPATATVELVFFDPLPDDRFTLTIADQLTDPVGNLLDGESNLIQPLETPTFPSGDLVPGGTFTARFTVDSRPEIGVWSAGSVYVDTNGNNTLDIRNLDYTNRDIVYDLGQVSDDVFAGNFVDGVGGAADGFDKLAAYGKIGADFRWLIDTDNDGVPNIDNTDPANINGLPVAGNFDGNAANGDEVGLFTGTTWYFDDAHVFVINESTAIVSELRGLPIVGDFDGDGVDDLGTHNESLNRFEFDLSGAGGLDGTRDATIDTLGFAGVLERPVAADVDQDGIDDVGLWVPHRSGALPEAIGEFYLLISNDRQQVDRVPGTVTTLAHDFTPIPFGKDVFAQFGDEFALPLLGNFDPPVLRTVITGGGYTNTAEAMDSNGDGSVSPIDALVIINALNRAGAGELDGVLRSSEFFVDTNADGYISPIDALLVINFLNRDDAEGEPIDAALATDAPPSPAEPASAQAVDQLLSAADAPIRLAEPLLLDLSTALQLRNRL